MNDLPPKHIRRSRPVAILVLALFYPLSFGPACWIASRTEMDLGGVTVINFCYFPVRWVYHHSSEDVQVTIDNYAQLGAGKLEIFIGEDKISIAHPVYGVGCVF